MADRRHLWGKEQIPGVLLVALALAWMLLATPRDAWAHKVNVFAYVEGDTIVTESYFNDGRKCRDSTIEVFDGAGRKLLEGTTDEGGMFSFKAPVRTDFLIRLRASMGHQAEYTIPAEDIPDSVARDSSIGGDVAAKPAEAPFSGQAADKEPVASSGEAAVQQIPATTDIEGIIDKVVARQLAPIRRALEEEQRRQRFSDVVGGIGYIIGLMGLALYFLGKRRKGE